MKRSLATLLTALILFSCGLTSVGIAEPTDTDAVWELVSDAYIYAFPLVLTDATKTLSTDRFEVKTPVFRIDVPSVIASSGA